MGRRFKKAEEILLITLGAALIGCALSVFLVPFKIAPGGVSGVSAVLHHLTGIRVSTLLMFINVPIFILGLMHFDKSFLFRSIYGTAVLSLSAELFSRIVLPTEDMFLASVFGGVVIGAGIALVLKSGGSTGGTDIIVLICRKFLPNLSVGNWFLLIDGFVILLAGATLGGWEVVLYSSATLFISTYITDAVLEGASFARMVYIISQKNEEITKQIYSEMNRGVTGLKSASMYTGEERQILLCVIRRFELPRLKELVYEVDDKAFVIISDAKEVLGNGFDRSLENKK